MLEMRMVEFDEKTNEQFFNEYCYEGQVISWSTSYSKGDVVKRFNDNCAIGRKLVRETKNNQEILDYWLSHMDKWNEYHRKSIEAGDMKENDIKKELDYSIIKVQLIEDGKVVKEEIFRYGR